MEKLKITIEGHEGSWNWMVEEKESTVVLGMGDRLETFTSCLSATLEVVVDYQHRQLDEEFDKSEAVIEDEIEQLRDRLAKDDNLLGRAFVHIYQFQTPDEQAAGVTTHDNGYGFNGTDGKWGGILANGFKQYKRLTPAMVGVGHKIIMKYAGQLIRSGFQWKEDK